MASPHGGPPPGQQQVAQVNAADVGSLVLNGTVGFVKHNYKFFLLWGLGLLVAAFGNGIPTSRQQRYEYERIMASVNGESMDRIAYLQNFYDQADRQYRYTKGWWTCNEECQDWLAKRDSATAKLDAAKAEVEGQLRDARRAIGLFSRETVEEARGKFWDNFARGKGIAKRSTYWDVVFMGVSMAMGRDETLMEFLFRVLSRVVMNITFGLLFALINFMFAIGAFLWSNAPDPVSGLIFFGLAMLAGFSIVATYLMVIYVAAAGTVVAGATIAMQNARALPASQRGAYIHGGRLHRDRPHYD